LFVISLENFARIPKKMQMKKKKMKKKTKRRKRNLKSLMENL
jgi:hypothetical protein